MNFIVLFFGNNIKLFFLDFFGFFLFLGKCQQYLQLIQLQMEIIL